VAANRKEMQNTLPDLEPLLSGHAELRDHVAVRVHGQHEMAATLYSIVAMKLFGYVFNTYKAIGLLLTDRYYEQGMSLFRTMWETGANLFWIDRDSETRAKLFLEFTAAEHKRFLSTRREFFKGRGVKGAADPVFPEVIQRVLDQQLAQFQKADRTNRLRTQHRFSGPSLENVVQELGEPWAEEYLTSYKLACGYTHGAPGAILFPLYAPKGDASVFERTDLERTTMLTAVSMKLMERVFLLYAPVIGGANSGFFDDLHKRTGYRGAD
jgi:hypothetical protein